VDRVQIRGGETVGADHRISIVLFENPGSPCATRDSATEFCIILDVKSTRRLVAIPIPVVPGGAAGIPAVPEGPVEPVGPPLKVGTAIITSSSSSE